MQNTVWQSQVLLATQTLPPQPKVTSTPSLFGDSTWRDHQCSPECSLQRFPSTNGDGGNTYVCRLSNNVHLCLAPFCPSAVSGSCCALTRRTHFPAPQLPPPPPHHVISSTKQTEKLTTSTSTFRGKSWFATGDESSDAMHTEGGSETSFDWRDKSLMRSEGEDAGMGSGTDRVYKSLVRDWYRFSVPKRHDGSHQKKKKKKKKKKNTTKSFNPNHQAVPMDF